MKRIACVLIAIATGCAATPARAANIEPFSTVCSSMAPRGNNWCSLPEHDILIDGEIAPGDAQKFESVVRAIGRRVSNVVLRSPGGSVPDAISIGRLVRKLMIETEGPRFYSEKGGASCGADHDHPNAACVCASACFLIYAGGLPREVSYVLLHRPFVNPSVNSRMSYDESIRVASEARKEVAEYLREMGIPDRYANIVFSTPSNAAAHVPLNDMRHAFAGYPPEVEEWLMAKCQTITTGQADRQLAEESARDGHGGAIENLAIKRSVIRGMCINDALKLKREAVRNDWFGPLTDAEKAKNDEEKRKFESLMRSHAR